MPAPSSIVSTVEVIKLTPKIKSCPDDWQPPFPEDPVADNQNRRFIENGCSVTRFCMDAGGRAACWRSTNAWPDLPGSTHHQAAPAPITGWRRAASLKPRRLVRGLALNEDASLSAIPIRVDMKRRPVQHHQTILIDSAMYQFFPAPIRDDLFAPADRRKNYRTARLPRRLLKAWPMVVHLHSRCHSDVERRPTYR